MVLFRGLPGFILITARVPAGCADCFDEPPAIVGWDLGDASADITNPTYTQAPYSWQFTGAGRDDFCPTCFDQPLLEPLNTY